MSVHRPVAFAAMMARMIAAAEWQPTADGATVGQGGPEGGVIARDETTARGTRILLEAEPSRSFYSVTVIIPDWMVYARFFDNEPAASAAYAEMKPVIEELAAGIPQARPTPGDPVTYEVGARLSQFMTRFP